MTSDIASAISLRSVTFPFRFASSSSWSIIVTGLPPVSFVFVAIPVMPDCHGIEYSRFGSKLGSLSASWRLPKFGIAFLSSFSAQPLSISRPGKRELSVSTTMSRSIDCPCESGRWIFPK